MVNSIESVGRIPVNVIGDRTLQIKHGKFYLSNGKEVFIHHPDNSDTSLKIKQNRNNAPKQIFDTQVGNGNTCYTLQGSKISGSQHEICVWDEENGRAIEQFPLENKAVKLAVNDNRAACGFDCRHFTKDTFGNNVVEIFDLNTGERTEQIAKSIFTESIGLAQSLLLDQNTLYLGFNDAFYQLDLRERIDAILIKTIPAYAICRLDGTHLLLGTEHDVILYDTSKRRTETLGAHTLTPSKAYPVSSVAATALKPYAASWHAGSREGMRSVAKIWNLNQGAVAVEKVGDPFTTGFVSNADFDNEGFPWVYASRMEDGVSVGALVKIDVEQNEHRLDIGFDATA